MGVGAVVAGPGKRLSLPLPHVSSHCWMAAMELEPLCNQPCPEGRRGTQAAFQQQAWPPGPEHSLGWLGDRAGEGF
jgi:hypothetical protein